MARARWRSAAGGGQRVRVQRDERARDCGASSHGVGGGGGWGGALRDFGGECEGIASAGEPVGGVARSSRGRVGRGDLCGGVLGTGSVGRPAVFRAEDVRQLAGMLRAFAETGTEAGEVVPERAPEAWRRLSMPSYPFQRRRHWLDAPTKEVAREGGDLRTWLTNELAAIMGEADASRLDPRRGFADLGIDSMMAAQLAEAIEREWGIELPVVAVFNYPTVEDLAAHLGTRRAKEAYAGRRCVKRGGAEGAEDNAEDCKVCYASLVDASG